MHEKLGSQLTNLDPALQVDVLWALCVLQQAREAELQAVLHPDFHTRFLGEQWSVPPAWGEPIPPGVQNRHAGALLPGRDGEYLLAGAPPRLLLCLLPQAAPPCSLCPTPIGSGSPKDQGTLQKLLHVNSTARLEHPEYTGPLLPASASAPRPSANRKVTPLQKELQDTLMGLLGTPERGSFMVVTQYGWVLGEGSPTLRPGRCGGSFHTRG